MHAYLLFLVASSVVVVSLHISGGTTNQHCQIMRCKGNPSYDLRYPTSAFNINAIRRRRHQPFCTSSTTDIDDSYNNSISVSSIASIRYPRRCSSKEAAAIIQNRSMNGLLIITCDASGRGGGSKHDGIASILRIRHGVSFLRQHATTNNTTIQFTNEGGKEDLIDVIARRTVPSRTSSEIAAISLGMKRAMRTIPQPLRKQVLILSDSEFALNFYCKSEHTRTFNNNLDNIRSPKRRIVNHKKRSKKGRRQVTQSMEQREEAHRRSLLAFMQDTPNGIIFSKVRSSSRGISVNNNDCTDIDEDNDDDILPWDGIGFIDHDAADHLSSITRSIANSYDDEEEDKKMIDIANAVEPLSKEDIVWLENSESDQSLLEGNSSNGFWKTIEVVGSEARYDRRERNKRRTGIIEDMLGLQQ